MKNIIPYLLILIPIIGFGQSPAKFNFQGVLSAPESAFGSTVTMEISIMDAENQGTTLFTESQAVSVGSEGLFQLQIGMNSSLETVDWSSGEHYLSVKVNGEEVSVSELVSVPSATYTSTAGGVITPIEYAQLTSAPDFSQMDTDESDDFDGDYLNLSNAPLTISQNEIDKLSLITVENGTDLDVLSADVAANSNKVSFPGFGTASGTAFIQKWSKVGNDVFLPEGKTGVGTTPNEFAGTAIHLSGSMKVQPSSITPTNGTLFYDQSTSTFKYYDAQGSLNELIIAGGQVFGSGYESAADVNIGEKLQIGSAVANSNDATLTVAGERPVLRFDDTSTSASFPSNDWEIVANGEVGEENYFGIKDASAGIIPFVIKDGNTSNPLTIDQNGNVGLKGISAVEKFDLTGSSVTSMAFVGNAKQLTGLSGSGTSNTTNSGSTTIESDNDGDLSGAIEFETNSDIKMTISPEGNVGVGIEPDPNAALVTSGGQVATEIAVDPTLEGFSLNVTGLKVVVFNTSPQFGFVSLSQGVIGQEVVIVNKTTTNISVFAGQIAPVLPQYGTVTLINTANGWVPKYRSI